MAPGSEKTKEVKRRRCEDFERHQRLVTRKLRPIAGDGGNLVITKDFFRERRVLLQGNGEGRRQPD